MSGQRADQSAFEPARWLDEAGTDREAHLARHLRRSPATASMVAARFDLTDDQARRVLTLAVERGIAVRDRDGRWDAAGAPGA